MSFPADTRAAFVAAAEQVEGVRFALDHEPKALPKALPGVTMLLKRQTQEARETGPATDVLIEWTVRLYASLRDYRLAQEQIEEIGPRLLTITAVDPRLDGSCDVASLEDAGETVQFDHDEGWCFKAYTLEAYAHSRSIA